MMIMNSLHCIFTIRTARNAEARTMLINCEVDVELWPKAINATCFMLNKVRARRNTNIF